MKTSEKVLRIIFFILTIPYGLYSLAQLGSLIYLILSKNGHWQVSQDLFLYFLSHEFWMFLSYFFILLIGIFALPVYRKQKNFLIPLTIMALIFTYSVVSSLVSFFSSSDYSSGSLTPVTINTLHDPIAWLSYVLMIISIIIYLLNKKLLLILPAVSLAISLIVNFIINAVYLTNWYWSLFPQDQIKEFGITSIYAVFCIFETLYFHSVFLLLLLAIKRRPEEKRVEDLTQIMVE